MLIGGFSVLYRSNTETCKRRRKRQVSETGLSDFVLRLVGKNNIKNVQFFGNDTFDVDEKINLCGGIQLNRTWIYDGIQWNEMAPMSIARDRPACSLVNMPNGKVPLYIMQEFSFSL